MPKQTMKFVIFSLLFLLIFQITSLPLGAFMSSNPSLLSATPNYNRNPPPFTTPLVIWDEYYGGWENDSGYAIVQCSDGGFAFTGTTRNWGPPGTLNLWLVRTEYGGDLIWDKTFGTSGFEEGEALVECLDGGFAIAGYTSDVLGDNEDFLIIRTDPEGNQLWNRTFGGMDDDHAKAILECGSTGFLVAGTTYSYSVSPGFEDIWLIRLDADGNHLWNVTYGTNFADRCYAVIECATNGFALAGATNQFGSDLDGWLLRLDADGNQLWNQTFDNGNNDECYDIVECQDGGFALAGTSQINARYDMWLIRTDSDGNLLLDQTFGGSDHSSNIAYAIVDCSLGGFALGGLTYRTDEDHYDFWLIRTTDTAIPQWDLTIGGNYHDYGYDLIECAEGGFALIGRTSSYGEGYQNAFLARCSDAYYPTTTDNRNLIQMLIAGSVIVVIIVVIIIIVLVVTLHKNGWSQPSKKPIFQS